MASQVLSGTSNVSYTNNTGQNVRIVINYMEGVSLQYPNSSLLYYNILINWGGGGSQGRAGAPLRAIGRNLAYHSIDGVALPNSNSYGFSTGSNNALGSNIGSDYVGSMIELDGALPTELMLAPGQTFSATCSSYNIVVIPENG